MVSNNNLLLGAGGQSTGAAPFDSTLIGNSVWLDGSADDLDRSTTSHSSTEMVMACWFQLGTASTGNIGLMGLGTGTSGSTNAGLWLSANKMYMYNVGQGAQAAQLFRDIGWYHVLGSWKLDESGTNKGKLYINGEEVTNWSDDRRGSFGTAFGSTATQSVGSIFTNTFLNGYIAQAVMLDGQSIQGGDVAITDFVDTFTFGTNGSQIIPKKDSDIAALATTAGGNSFCLDFSNSSDLGNDISSNNNDLTPNSMSSANQSISTPSKTYSVFNPNAKRSSAFTLSNGNRTAVTPGADQWIKTTIPFVMSGSNIIRAEFTFDSVGQIGVGITGSSHTSGTYHTAATSVAGRGEVALFTNSGALGLAVDGNFNNPAFGGSDGLSNGDIVDVFVNCDVGAVYFAVNGTIKGGASQSDIQNGVTTNAAQAVTVGGQSVNYLRRCLVIQAIDGDIWVGFDNTVAVNLGFHILQGDFKFFDDFTGAVWVIRGGGVNVNVAVSELYD